MRVVENLLHTPFPLENGHHRTIFEKCGKLAETYMYNCNICKIKLLGESKLLEHNTSFGHHAALEQHISEELKSRQNGKAPNVKLTPLAKKMISEAALRTAEMNLVAAIADLKNEYLRYRENAALHPMYMKEWQIFYLRRLSDLLAANENPATHDFTADWTVYWLSRIQVYYNRDLRFKMNQIGATYTATMLENGISPSWHEREMAERTKPSTNGQTTETIIICDSDASTDEESQSASVFDIGPKLVTDSQDSSSFQLSTCSHSATSSQKPPSYEKPPSSEKPQSSEKPPSSEKSSRSQPSSEALSEPEINSETETESDTDVEFYENMTSKLRIVPYYLDDTEPSELSSIRNKASDSTKHGEDINVTVAGKVIDLLHRFGLNPKNLADKHVVNYINFVVKENFPKKVRQGSIETINSDSNDSFK